MKPVPRFAVALSAVVTLLLGVIPAESQGENFLFGILSPELNLQPFGSVTKGEFEMQLVAGPSGSKLTTSGGGLGVTSADISGVVDTSGIDFGVLSGTNAELAGTSEFIQFSLDKPGRITGIDLNGVKEETLEYFVLASNDLRVNFFDSAADPDVLDSAIMDGAISGDVVYLLEDSSFDDEIYNLSIPFAAGQQFTLTYGYLGVEYGTGPGNGARLQQLVVAEVPEPASPILAAVACVLSSVIQRRRSRSNLIVRIGRLRV